MVVLSVAALVVVAALPPAQEQALVAAARAQIGTQYVLGARRDGVDCQGLVFLALQRVFGCGWRSYDVMPTTSVARGELGDVVVTATSADVDVRALQPGDVLHFLGPARNPAEPAIATLGGSPRWVWHMGLYAGDGRFVVGDHYAGAVVEEDLAAYLRAHADAYDGLLVTRMKDGPKPARCRSRR